MKIAYSLFCFLVVPMFVLAESLAGKNDEVGLVVVNNIVERNGINSGFPSISDKVDLQVSKIMDGVLNVDVATGVTDWIQLFVVFLTLVMLLQTTYVSNKGIKEAQATQQLIAKDNIKLQENIHRQNRFLQQMQIKQKDRELRQGLVENRVRWMQEMRSAYCIFVASVYDLIVKSKDNKDGSVDVLDIVSKAVNFNILLNPVDDIHSVIISIKEDAMKSLSANDFDGALADLDRISILIQFIIRLEWQLAKNEMAKSSSVNSDDVVKEMVLRWVKKNIEFKKICDDYHVDYL